MPRITKRLIDALRPNQGAQKDLFAWDGELRGFGVRRKPNWTAPRRGLWTWLAGNRPVIRLLAPRRDQDGEIDAPDRQGGVAAAFDPPARAERMSFPGSHRDRTGRSQKTHCHAVLCGGYEGCAVTRRKTDVCECRGG